MVSWVDDSLARFRSVCPSNFSTQDGGPPYRSIEAFGARRKRSVSDDIEPRHHEQAAGSFCGRPGSRQTWPFSLELRDLRWAIIASQHRSLRQAAETLNVRQSTLSRRLREIESRVGAKLFERTNGGTSSTPAGREFLVTARNILAETEVAIRRLQTRSHGENGRLAIGIYASLSTGNMFATLLDHHRSFPEVEVHTVDGEHDELMCGLTNKTIDIAIMTSSGCAWDDRMLPLWSERVIAALHVRHPFWGRSRQA
jgi:DNA-binding transcriptional LysR family regulator